MTRIRFNIAFALVFALSPSTRAQDRAVEPVVRTSVDPPRVVVGQHTTLRIEVLAPNYMTSPPQLPAFQIRNAVTQELPAANFNEQHSDLTFAGVRYEFAISPQEPGSYAVADQKVRITYATEPPATREVELPLPPIHFEAFVPDTAASLRPFISASRLTIEQKVDRSSEHLKIGDAVTRRVTVTAEGTLAMLLPPPIFPEMDGLRRYPAQPALDDRRVGRSAVNTASRTDFVTYMLVRPGDYVLPAIDIRWFDTVDGKIAIAHTDSVAFSVAGDPASATGLRGASPERSWTWRDAIAAVAERWPIVLVAAAALAGVAWLAPRTIRAIAVAMRRRRMAHLRSESWAFRQLRDARGAEATYFRLLQWLQRFEPMGSDRSVTALTSATGDPILRREIDALQTELFSPVQRGSAWSRRSLLRRLAAARHVLRQRARPDKDNAALPRDINPTDRLRPAFGHRRIAR